MNQPLPACRAGRREFFRAGLRFTLLGALAAMARRLTLPSRAKTSTETCTGGGICGGCDAFEICGLPRALSVKGVRDNPPLKSL